MQIYFRNTPSPNITTINDQFQTAFRNDTDNTTLVQKFQGRRAIVISKSTYGKTNQNVHPGAFSSDGRFNDTEDPTLRAVVLASFPGESLLH